MKNIKLALMSLSSLRVPYSNLFCIFVANFKIMEKIISLLKSTQGIFASTIKQNPAVTLNYPIPYRGIEHDKQNMRNDMLHLFSDLRKAAGDAIS
jgi:hypothetical protein